MFNILKTLAALSGNSTAQETPKNEAPPRADRPLEQSTPNQEAPAHNIMADVIARHEQAIYRIKGRG